MTSIDFGTDGVRDYEYERTRQEQGTNEPSLQEKSLAEARKRLFEGTKVTENGVKRSVTVLEAIFRSICARAAQGDHHALAELSLLESHQQRQVDVAAGKRAFANSPVRALEAKHAPIAKIFGTLRGWMYLQMLPCFLEVYRKVEGFDKTNTKCLPYYLEEARIKDISNRLRRRARKTRGKEDYAVGYGKPPVETRFTTDRNPRSKGKASDAWGILNRSRDKSVVVRTNDGKTIDATLRTVGIMQLYRDAIRGKRRALSETRKIIIQLDQKAMLSPSERARRARRKIKPMAVEHQILIKAMEMRLAPTIKRDMVSAFASRFGAVPVFITAYERQLSAFSETKVWSGIADCIANSSNKSSKNPSERDDPITVAELTPVKSARIRTCVAPASSKTDDASAILSSPLSAGHRRPRAKVPPVKKSKTATSGGKPTR